MGSIATWATNDLNNTAKFTSARTLQYAFNGATEVAVQNIRYTPLLATTVPGPASCWTGGSSVQIDNQNIDVWCSTSYNPTSPSTRVVTFNACLHGGSATTCAAMHHEPHTSGCGDVRRLSNGNEPAEPCSMCRLLRHEHDGEQLGLVGLAGGPPSLTPQQPRCRLDGMGTKRRSTRRESMRSLAFGFPSIRLQARSVIRRRHIVVIRVIERRTRRVLLPRSARASQLSSLATPSLGFSVSPGRARSPNSCWENVEVA